MMLFYTTGNMNFSLYSPHFLLLEITWKKNWKWTSWRKNNCLSFTRQTWFMRLLRILTIESLTLSISKKALYFPYSRKTISGMQSKCKRWYVKCKIDSLPCFFKFFYLGILSRTFTIHWTAGEGGGYFFNFSLPLPSASQTLRH